MRTSVYGPYVNQISSTSPTPDFSSPIENTSIVSSPLNGVTSVSMLTSSVFYYTTASTANFTLNFVGGANSTLNGMLSSGQSISAVILATNGATAYYLSAIQIDGAAVTPVWFNGTAPTAGNASSIDIYNFTILKTGNATYKVLASGPSRFA